MKVPLQLKRRLDPTMFGWILNIFLAILVYCNAEVGRLLGIAAEPLAISLVWPATGVSLAALLLFGFKMWPGVLLGNLIYNSSHFWAEDPYMVRAFIAAFMISAGSLGQGLAGAWIMRRFCSAGYFNTVKDLFIFLLPVGIGTTLISSVVGILTLYLYGAVASDAALQVWFTFWIGDSLGVYVLTPFLVVWSTHQSRQNLWEHGVEVALMVLLFVGISVLAFAYDYPLAHLYLPLCVWISYRFFMHGATLAVFAFAFMAIVPTALGVGAFVKTLTADPLLILVTFLMVIIFTCYIVAAVVNERQVAWDLLHFHNVDLQQALVMQKQEMREMGKELIIKEKLTSLSVVTSHIARLLHFPLKTCRNFIEASLDSVRRLQQISQDESVTENEQFSREVVTISETLEGYLLQAGKFETQAREIAHLIKQQTTFTVLGTQHEIRQDINSLLDSCLHYIEKEISSQSPPFVFSIVKRLDQRIGLSYFQPEELARSFIYLFRFCIASMKVKKEVKSEEYVPMLEVDSKEVFNQVLVTVRDNGMGVDPERLKQFFQSFVNAQDLARVNHIEESISLGLSLAHDIIVHVYHGKISVESVFGESTEIHIAFPKVPLEKSR